VIPSHDHPFHGIYVATLTPFQADGRIDETALAAHFRKFAAVPGIVGVLCNGHAGENFLLSREERRRVTAIAAETIGRTHIVVSGILCEATREAAEHAQDARAAGAHCALVFPPFSWALSQDGRMAVTHHRIIGEACGMPMMLYQAGVSSALAYRPEVLAQLVQLPHVVGIKEGSWESNAYDRNRRLVRSVAPHVAVMASGDEHLLSCFVVGSDGSLVSLAVLMPAEIVALDQAVRAGDLAAARRLHHRIQPLANAIYGTAPAGLATARLKACMVLTGEWQNGAARAPITELASGELERLSAALIEAGVIDRVANR
jgi:4-hydroxy-tetrahydrodipicolinate synthase